MKLPQSFRWEWVFLSVLFILSVAIRWYRLPEYLFFGFEQGRDAAIIQDISQRGDFHLVGPKTDLAGIFHGAYYYYLMAPAYSVGGGDPLVASFFLVVLSSSVPVLLYLFSKDFFASKIPAVAAGILGMISFEYIIYSRWLSNVTPAIPLVILTFWFLWRYRMNLRPVWFILAALCAALAAQFELVLVLLLGCSVLVLLAVRVIPVPDFKTWLVASCASGLVFVPHLIFDARNEHIIVRSVMNFLSGGRGPVGGDFQTASYEWFEHSARIFRKSLSLPEIQWLVAAVAVGIVLGCCLGWYRAKEAGKNNGDRQRVLFLLVWSGMALPILAFGEMVHLNQLYLGSGLGYILLAVYAGHQLWREPWGRLLVIGGALSVAVGFVANGAHLHANRDVFFRTIQDDLNYADQRALLEYVHADAAGEVYRLEAFTIPYLQPEGWEYLQNYWNPHTTDRGVSLVYVVIEEKVPPEWRERWLKDIGVSELLDERQFGRLVVQKRRLQAQD